MSQHKALLLEMQGEFAVRNVYIPKPGPGDILVKVTHPQIIMVFGDYLKQHLRLFRQRSTLWIGRSQNMG
jgi:hypothetical protein